ncbi:Ig-like domain-containing protein [Patescibacteria group bacterium]|nr:Ig-like domain-containing protein [Patescibacteria group bacterium]
MARYYSRLASVEEKRNIRRAFIFGVLTIAAIVFLFTIGLNVLTKFVGVISDLRKTSTPIEKTDTTPPPPPRLDTLPDATNNSKIQITGSSEPGSTVELFVNGAKNESLAGNDGVFSFDIYLDNGSNNIYATAKDSAGNESGKTPTYEVIYSKNPPKIDISSPSDGAKFYGNKQQQITISGKTSPDSSVTINDRIVGLQDDGSFSSSVFLNDGDNTFKIKVQDKAGNTAEKSITVNYSP